LTPRSLKQRKEVVKEKGRIKFYQNDACADGSGGGVRGRRAKGLEDVQRRPVEDITDAARGQGE